MTQTRKKPLEKFLNLFTEVRAGEGTSAILLLINIFTLMTAYYIIKPVREALILTGGGAEVKSYSAAGQAILFLIAVPLYSRLAAKFPRKQLINVVITFFASCLGLFYVLALFKVPLGVIFFLWVGVFNMMVMAQFWSFANDLYTPAGGKRIFALIAFGASSGAVAGSFLAGKLIGPLGVYQLMLVSAALIMVSLIFTNVIDSRGSREQVNEGDAALAKTEEPLPKGKIFDAFELVLKNKYLLLIGLMILVLNWVNTTGEYILSKVISESAVKLADAGKTGGLSVGEFIGKFYADFFFVVNWVGMVTQLFLVSRIIKYVGIRAALLILPVVALGGYFIIAFIPILSIVRWSKTMENSLDYSLQNTIRQALFLPTTREEKYKAKQAIDTFILRVGDLLSAVLVYVGTTWLAFHIKEFALFNIGLVIILIFISLAIGREYKRLTS